MAVSQPSGIRRVGFLNAPIISGIGGKCNPAGPGSFPVKAYGPIRYSEEMRIALAQQNPVVGDIAGNLAGMERAIARAADHGCDLVVFAELSVLGYPPRDLLRKERFVSDSVAAVEALARRCTDVGG